MKKAGRLISYLLVLTLVTGLFSGVVLYNTPATEARAGVEFNVLELVPHKDMATFFYFVDMSKHTATSDPKVGGNSLATNTASATFAQYLVNANCGVIESNKYKSSDYFFENVLSRAGLTDAKIKVTTVTPGDLKNNLSLIEQADLIVINQTVPMALQTVPNGTSTKKITIKTFDELSGGEQLTTEMVLRIFKKIAGAEGNKAIPYIIDFKLYNGAAFKDVRSINNDVSNAYGGYIPADKVHVLTETIEPAESDVGYYSQNPGSFYHMGTDKLSFKLYKLLSCIDPSTLYGLYFTGNDGSYGVDEDLNLIVAKPTEGKTKVISYNLGGKDPGWTDTYFRPNYLATTSKPVKATVSETSYTNAMGWFEANTKNGDKLDKDPGEFCQVIGGKSGEAAGKGIVYNSSKGLFHVMQSQGGEIFTGGSGNTDSDPYASLVDITSNLKFEPTVSNYQYLSWNSSHQYDFGYKITYTGSGPITNWMIVCNTSDVQSVTCYYGMSGSPEDDKLIFTGTEQTSNMSNGSSVQGNGIIIGNVGNKTTQITNALKNYKAYYNPNAGTSGSTGDGADQLASIVYANKNYSSRTDYYPYRFLVVTGNTADSSVNRNVIAKMVGYANSKGIGLVGGITVDCISWKQFENISYDLNHTYDAICIGRSLTSEGEAKLATYKGSVFKDTNFTSGKLINKFESIVGRKFGLSYITVPKEYYTNLVAKYFDYNGHTGYQTIASSLKVEHDLNYINDEYSPNKRDLDFNFDIIGDSDKYYDIDLFVDLSNDGIYGNADKEKKRIATGKQGGSNINKTGNDAIKLSEFGLPDDFVGGFSWKLLVTEMDGDEKDTNRKATGKTVSRIGYSAIRNTDYVSHKIRILQIYPTGYMSDFGSRKGDAWISNPLLLIPTKAEIRAANNAKGSILNCTWGGSGNQNLQNYFSGIMSFDNISNGVRLKATNSEVYDYFWGDGVKNVNKNDYTLPGAKGNDIMVNSTVFYQFLALLDNYDVEVDRYSVYGFSQAYGTDVYYDAKDTKRFVAAASGDVQKNPDESDRYGYTASDLGLDGSKWQDQKVTWDSVKHNKYLYKKYDNKEYIYGELGDSPKQIYYYKSTKNVDGKTVNGTLLKNVIKNLDGSDRYGYSPSQLKLTNGWQDVTQSWSEGKVKKYLTNEAGTLIYGERGGSDGQVTYYGSKKVVDGSEVSGTLIRCAGEAYDLIMLGFGNTMDYMNPVAVAQIKQYLQDGGPAFVGNGTVTGSSSNNNLGKQIKSELGMGASNGSAYDPFEKFNQEIMITNDTLFSHYPYKINHYMWGTAAGVQPYKLDFSDVNDQPVVSYARYSMDNQKDAIFRNWGDSQENYYLYRYKNITFCGFGNTFRSGTGGAGAIGNIMTVAETLMIVNALITSASGGQSGKKSEPYIKCIDVDGSYIDAAGMEQDQAKSFKDSVYTDFDSEEIANFYAGSDTSFNTPLSSGKIAKTITIGEETVVGEFDKTYSEREGDKLKHTGFIDATTKIRWIPYKATLATKEGGYLKFIASDLSQEIPIQLYKFEFKESGEGHYEFVLQSKDSSSGMYKIDENAVYYIGIPIYATEKSSGFVIRKDKKNVDQFAIRFYLYGGTSASTLIEEHIVMMIRRVIYQDK